MPKTTFLDSILGRPSQTYASSLDRDSQPSYAYAGHGKARSDAPSDLPNTPVNGSGNLLGGRSPGSHSRFYYSSPSESDAPSAASSLKSRLAAKRGKHTPRSPLPNGSTPPPEIPDASPANHFSRWWENSLLRPSGAASDLGAASEPGGFARGPGPHTENWRRAMASPAARSEFGADRSRGWRSGSGSHVPPMPTTRYGAGVSPLGQEQPSLLAPPQKRSLAPPHQRAPTYDRTRDSDAWYEFVRAREAGTAPAATSTPPQAAPPAIEATTPSTKETTSISGEEGRFMGSTAPVGSRLS